MCGVVVSNAGVKEFCFAGGALVVGIVVAVVAEVFGGNRGTAVR